MSPGFLVQVYFTWNFCELRCRDEARAKMREVNLTWTKRSREFQIWGYGWTYQQHTLFKVILAASIFHVKLLWVKMQRWGGAKMQEINSSWTKRYRELQISAKQSLNLWKLCTVVIILCKGSAKMRKVYCSIVVCAESKFHANRNFGEFRIFVQVCMSWFTIGEPLGGFHCWTLDKSSVEALS